MISVGALADESVLRDPCGGKTRGSYAAVMEQYRSAQSSGQDISRVDRLVRQYRHACSTGNITEADEILVLMQRELSRLSEVEYRNAPLESMEAAEPAASPQPLRSSSLKTLTPPTTGMIMGQTHLGRGGDNVGTFERAIGRSVGLVFDYSLVKGKEEAGRVPLTFNVHKAISYWNAGKMVMVGAYEAYPGHPPFTVDRLIRGDYDKALTTLAAQFRSFGKPMFFSTAREPNGVLLRYLGGFGKDGDQPLKWAIDRGKGLAEFQPPPGPEGNPDLFKGLGQPDVNDGIERLAAAQRYYHDFFTRREGLDFLVFDSMGWSIHPYWDAGHQPGSHADQLTRSINFQLLYERIKDTVDWISVTWYLNTHPNEPEEEVPIRSIQEFTDSFDRFMRDLGRIAPGKPVLVAELGFPDPDQGEKVDRGMSTLLKHNNVKAFVMWGVVDKGIDCLIRPGTDGASAFRRILKANPGKFYSSVDLNAAGSTD